jgi:hypothetical protein
MIPPSRRDQSRRATGVSAAAISADFLATTIFLATSIAECGVLLPVQFDSTSKNVKQILMDRWADHGSGVTRNCDRARDIRRLCCPVPSVSSRLLGHGTRS